jgi:mannose-6-phosphate isomerase-like protein (cupin superfamily)
MKYIFNTEQTTRYSFPTHINDLVMDRSYAKYSEVFIVLIEPDKAPPLHKHDDTEQIFFIMQGNGVLRIGEKGQDEYEVNPGDVVRIPVSIWHSIKATKGKTLKYIAIDCFGSIRSEQEPTWESHVKVLCKEQNWDFDAVKK